MRDGVKLYTVIVIPKGATHAPILLTRTPYNAAHRAQRNQSSKMLDILPQGDDVFVGAGYIRVFQDVRGKYGSEGAYLMTPPPIGPLNTQRNRRHHRRVRHHRLAGEKSAAVERQSGNAGFVLRRIHGGDGADPSASGAESDGAGKPDGGWLDGRRLVSLRRVPAEQSGLHPRNKLRCAAKASRLRAKETTTTPIICAVGSAGDFARAGGLDQLPFWRKIEAHPAYDAFWQGQALDKIMATLPLDVPIMWEQGLWDQEDMWGAIHSYAAVEPKDTHNDKNFLVMGPWRHSQVNYDGYSLGPLLWDGDTTCNSGATCCCRFSISICWMARRRRTRRRCSFTTLGKITGTG